MIIIGKRIILILLIIASTLFSQSYNISHKADSLTNYLISNGYDTNAKLALLDEYLQVGEPELALLELIELENSFADSTLFIKERGKVHFWLGDINKTSTYLGKAYHDNPQTETLAYLLIIGYANGDSEKYTELLSNSPDREDLITSVFSISNRLRKQGNTRLADAGRNIIKDYDANIFEELFVRPQITILHDEEELFSLSDEYTLKFQVTHNRAIKKIVLNETEIFIPDSSKKKSSLSQFEKEFSQNVSLAPGDNRMVVSVNDEIGNSTRDEINIVCLNFRMSSVTNTKYIDRFSDNLNNLKSYVPENILSREKNEDSKALVIAGGSTESHARAKLWFNILHNKLTSRLTEENVKALTGDFINQKNISLLLENWLNRKSNKRSKIILYLNHPTPINDDQIFIKDDNTKINISSFINELVKNESHEIILIVENLDDKKMIPENYVADFIKNSINPITIIQFNEWNNIFEFIDDLVAVDIEADDKNPEFGFTYLQNFIKSSNKLTNVEDELLFLSHPGNNIGNLFRKHYSEFKQKLNSDNNSDTEIDKKIILQFCNNWKRFREILKYLESEITPKDLETQAKEYYSRINLEKNN